MTKPERFMAVADSHGALINPRAERAALDFKKEFKPTVLIHLGDAWNLGALRVGADEKEREESIKDDFKEAERFLTAYFKGGHSNIYLNGNHDRPRIERLLGHRDSFINDAAEEALQKMDAIHRKNRCRVLPYDSRAGVLRLGHLKAVHGYACGRNATQVHARVYGNVMHGHTHTIESVAIENIDGPAEARAIGALCQLDQDYNARQLNKLRHGNGWAYGYLFPDGSYQVFQAREVAGSFYAATNIVAF